ncbi:MAG: response regulator [Candidatus Wallbacteria bacterium]|nr:response regulator [Candidatus Wallbacteria bacterium]
MGRLTGRPAALIVDDSQFICRILAKSLLDYGFRLVALAASCEEALVQAAAFVPDLITLDLVLPDGHGFELYQKLRDVRPESRILIVSDIRQVENFDKAREIGAAGFLSKPFQESQLVQLLQNMDLEGK